MTALCFMMAIVGGMLSIACIHLCYLTTVHNEVIGTKEELQTCYHGVKYLHTSYHVSEICPRNIKVVNKYFLTNVVTFQNINLFCATLAVYGSNWGKRLHPFAQVQASFMYLFATKAPIE